MSTFSPEYKVLTLKADLSRIGDVSLSSSIARANELINSGNVLAAVLALEEAWLLSRSPQILQMTLYYCRIAGMDAKLTDRTPRSTA